MEFLESLAKARKSHWVKFPGTNLELNVRPLTTTEIDRCRRMAQKKNRVDQMKYTRAVYTRAVSGLRGFDISVAESLDFEPQAFTEAIKDIGIELNGQPIGSDPITKEHLDLVVGLSLSGKFVAWIIDHTGQNMVNQEEDLAEGD